MSDEDLEQYKGRPSRRKVKAKLPADLRAAAGLGMNLSIRKPKRKGTRASKKTQGSAQRAIAREAQAETDTFRSGGRGK